MPRDARSTSRQWGLLLIFVVLATQIVANTNRVLNLSSRAYTSADGFIAGFVVGPGEPKSILIRVAGPSLNQFPGVTDVLANPKLEIYDSQGRKIVENLDWVRPTPGAEASAADFGTVGAFTFTSPLDAAIVAKLVPGAYTVRARSEDERDGFTLIEVYDLSGTARLVNLSTRARIGALATGVAAGVIVAPGESRRVLIRAIGPALSTFGIGDFLHDPVLSVTDAAGVAVGFNNGWGTSATRAQVLAAFQASGAFPFSDSESKDCAVILDLAPGAYTAHVTSAQKQSGTTLVEIYDLSPQVSSLPVTNRGSNSTTVSERTKNLYSASLLLPEALTASAASGYTTLLLSAADNTATLSFQFAGLSSAQTSAHLRIGTDRPGEDALIPLPGGQVSGYTWTIRPTDKYTIADILTALNEGRLFLTVETAGFPKGELQGRFLRAKGSITFPIPDDPPAISDLRMTAANAARFLLQATFGPTQPEIDALTGKGMTELNAWIDAQVIAATSSHRDATTRDYEQFTKPLGAKYHLSQQNRQAAWWSIAVKGKDQLRQRVAFALSQIFVVSENHSILFDRPAEMAAYYDLLARNAFGNFRQLLEEVTLSPVMGVYLSHLQNAKATEGTVGIAGTRADENYAREVMQLFTIGRTHLHPDGSHKLDSSGMPIPTYDETTVKDMARVFTGWGFASQETAPSFKPGFPDFGSPMRLYPDFHDDTSKIIITGRVLPGAQGGAKDLKDTLDTLFNHPNTGTFICRQLIQRLVTSNPSPGYIYRVARVFEDSGRGVRGDLGAVVRAILTDYEARSWEIAQSRTFGKLREPLLRATGMLRSLNGDSNSGRINFGVSLTDAMGQTPLRAPTVFNFFEPDFVRAGPLANAGLYSPEFQTLTAASLVVVTNFFQVYLNTRPSSSPDDQLVSVHPAEPELDAAKDPKKLVDMLDARLTGGSLPGVVKERIIKMLGPFLADTRGDLDSRYRSVAYVILASPHGAIQK